MKVNFIIPMAFLSAVLLSACQKEEPEREPIPQMETAPPHSQVVYTGTTVEFYPAETRRTARYGTFPAAGFPEADTGIEIPDFADITADTAAVTADTGAVTADFAGITMDSADFGADTADVSADTAAVFPDNADIVPDTADNYY